MSKFNGFRRAGFSLQQALLCIVGIAVNCPVELIALIVGKDVVTAFCEDARHVKGDEDMASNLFAAYGKEFNGMDEYWSYEKAAFIEFIKAGDEKFGFKSPVTAEESAEKFYSKVYAKKSNLNERSDLN